MKIWLRSSQLWVESFKLLWFFSQEISADQSVTSVSPEDRRCLFPEVLKFNLKLSKCFVSFRRGNWAATMATREEGEIENAKSGSFYFFADVYWSARTTMLHNRTTLAVCPGENSLPKYVPMLYFNLILFLGTCQTLTLQCVILGLQFSLTNINVGF